MAILTVVSGCAPRVVPLPIPAPSSAPAAPVPVVVPTATRYSVPGLVTDTRYGIESIAQLERDSAGRRDVQSITSRAQTTVRLRRTPDGAFSGSGRIIGYSVSSALSATPIVIDSLRFQTVLDPTALRVAMQPPLANECDRPETGALSLVRDLLLRVPGSIAVGDQWRDSTVQIVCRSSVPMIVRTTNAYVATDAVRGRDGMELSIRRTSVTRVEGKTTSPWRSVDIAGTGSAVLTARVAVNTGVVHMVQSTSTLTLTVNDLSSTSAVRAQQVIQRVTFKGDVIGQ